MLQGNSLSMAIAFVFLTRSLATDPQPRDLLLAAAAPLLPGGRYYAATSTGSHAGEASWQSANTLETLASVALVQPDAYAAVRTAFAEAWAATSGVPHDFEHYDDYGWWALALLRFARVPPTMPAAPASASADALGGTDALNYVGMARTVFEMYVRDAWSNDTCGGGVYWGPVHGAPSYKNAITNELFLALSAELFEATGEARFGEWAARQWAWLSDASAGGAMRGAASVNGGLYNDGLSADWVEPSRCVNNNSTVWTYNQGVILGGLASFHRATNDSSLLVAADATARAAMARLVDGDGVLRESCEGGERMSVDDGAGAATGADAIACNGDQQLFKGAFARHLWYLSTVAAPADAADYRAFLSANAASAIALDRPDLSRNFSAFATFGLHWAGPFDGTLAGAATQSAALDLIVAAAAPPELGALPPLRVRCAAPVDSIGAWQRPGVRCEGDSGELLPRGRSLAECQAACLAKQAPGGSCAAFTWTADGVLGANNICNVFAAQPGGNGGCAAPTVDVTGCGTRYGCRFTSGSPGCVLP